VHWSDLVSSRWLRAGSSAISVRQTSRSRGHVSAARLVEGVPVPEKPPMLRAATNQLALVKPTPVGPNASTMFEHLEYLKYRHRRTFDLLDKSVISDIDAIAERSNRLKEIRGHSDFDDDERGAAYRDRQLAVPRAREYGDLRIFAELAKRLGGFTFKQVGLDVIGGNGTTARNAANLLPLESVPYIIAGDPCLDMVDDALERRLPAVWQCAQETLFADESLDFVIGSRGFHHVSASARAAVFAESWRILKRRGVTLVVDFEEGSPTARWYSEGLDRYTNTGHRFSHFRRAEFRSLLTSAGFRDIDVFELYDPFRFWADTAEGARNALLEHLLGMFGMVKLRRESGEAESDYWARVDRTVSPWCTFAASEVAFDREALPRLSVFQEADQRWRAEFPRVALCAIGIK
jgi:ubiquinone/menaquinone biosynthesis C-methylase UbiE